MSTDQDNESSLPPLDVRAALAGQKLILLGATGFLGKVWLSMLLDRYPEIDTLYMMVRPRNQLDSTERFWTEIVPSPAFDPLRKKYPGPKFEVFLRERIVPISGDIIEPMLGIHGDIRDRLRGHVSAIVNVSGVVDFNPPLDDALQVNAFGAQNLIELARDLGDCAILHTSTCFVVGARNGVTPERNPLDFPFPRADELDVSHWDADREIAECIDLVEQAKRRVEDAPRQSHLLDEAKQNLRERREPMRGQALTDELDRVKRQFVRRRLIDAGKERAQFWGWPNIYTYTKSIGEQVLMRCGLPVTIVRPSIVESALSYPVAGWCEGVSTSTPIAYLVFKGQQHLPVHDNCHFDAIPVDMCAAAMIAVLAGLLRDRHREVYQLCTSDRNPLPTKRAAAFLGLAKRLHYDNKGSGNFLLNQLQSLSEPAITDLKTFRRRSTPAMHRMANSLQHLLQRSDGTAFEDATRSLRNIVGRYAKQTQNISNVFEEFIPFIAGSDMRFSGKNTQTLMESLTSEDRRLLPWDPESIDWRHFWMEVHIPGMQKWSFPLLEERLNKESKPLRRHDNLAVFLDDLVQKHEHSVAMQVLEGETLSRISYGELLCRVHGLVERLLEVGIRKGDRIALVANNHPNWAIAYFAVVKLGAVAVPLDKDSNTDVLERILKASASKILIGDESIQHRVSCLPVWDLVQVCSELGPIKLELPENIKEGDLASILYTSGTTAEPKGVMLSHGNFTAMIASLAPLFPLDHRDRLLSVLPLHHTFEFTCGLLLPLSRGARIIYLDEVNRERLSTALQVGRVTSMVGVPAVWELLERRILNEVRDRGVIAEKVFSAMLAFNRNIGRTTGMDLGKLLFAPIHLKLGGRLRFLISGAAALPSEVYETFQGLGLQMAEGYGLTEAAPVLAVSRPSTRSRGGHVGKAIPGVELKIDHANERGVGEIVAKGPNIMQGYADQIEATHAVLQEGWLRTGDLGQMDSRGRLRIVGRSKEVIISTSGENVYPDDVETALGHLKHIEEYSLVGVPDRHSGECVACLAVVADCDGAIPPDLEEQALRSLREAIEKLPRYQRPVLIYFTHEKLPRTATKKVQRVEVRKIVEKMRASASAQIKVDDSRHQVGVVRTLISNLLRVAIKDMHTEQDLVADLGMDSLLAVELLAALEAEFPRLDSEKLANCRTVGELENAVLRFGEHRAGVSPSRTQSIEADEEELVVPEFVKPPVKAALNAVQLQAYAKLMRTKVFGRANIPHDRPTLVIANHCSHLDVGLIKYGLGSYGQGLAALAAEDYFFTGKWRKAYFEHFTNVEPLDRKHGLRRALTQAAEVIGSGKTVLIFPEGTRSLDGTMKEFLPLIGHLSLHHGIDILPVYLGGTHQAFPKGAVAPKFGSRLSVKIGPPLRVDDLDRLTNHLKRGDAYRRVARLAEEAIRALRDGSVLDLRYEALADEVQSKEGVESESKTALIDEIRRHEPTPVDKPSQAEENSNLRVNLSSSSSTESSSAETYRGQTSTSTEDNREYVNGKSSFVSQQVVDANRKVAKQDRRVNDSNGVSHSGRSAQLKKTRSPMEVLFDDLERRFVAGATEKPLSFYFSLGDEVDGKWTLHVDAEHCSVKMGRPEGGRADCVLKTSPEIFSKIVRERYVPGMKEFIMGRVKSNDIKLLRVFQKVFNL